MQYSKSEIIVDGFGKIYICEKCNQLCLGVESIGDIIFSNIASYCCKAPVHKATPEELKKHKTFITTQDKISMLFTNYEEFLKEKNMRYGDSAMDPIGIFSKGGAEKNLLTRIDDKLSRIKNSEKLRKNDVSDLFGYIALLMIEQGWDTFDEFLD